MLLEEPPHIEIVRIAILRELWGDPDARDHALEETFFLLTQRAASDLKEFLADCEFALFAETTAQRKRWAWVFKFPNLEIMSATSAVADLGRILYELSGIKMTRIVAMAPCGKPQRFYTVYDDKTKQTHVAWEVWPS